MSTVKLVYDGTEVRIPEELGMPREDQMQGTELEKLAELAGRSCYDSLGAGRSSADFHKHIREVKHHSVLRHCNCVICIPSSIFSTRELLELFIITHNLPGKFLGVATAVDADIPMVRLCVNLQTIAECENWLIDYDNEMSQFVAFLFKQVGKKLAPQCFQEVEIDDSFNFDNVLFPPLNDEERWISLYMSGSRGFSHEQVRHNHRSAVSQRSTRYCDETRSEWIRHPLLTQYLNSDSLNAYDLLCNTENTIDACQVLYKTTVERLQTFLKKRDVDSLTARKQARGAARGILGNALETELIWSASVSQWRRQLRQRLSNAADAEIRLLYALVLDELRKSQYADRFADLETEDAKDGIGIVLKEKVTETENETQEK